MAISIKHTKVSTIPDEADTSLVRPSDWNSEHSISGVAASGANSDITSLSGITGGISTPDYVAFDTTYATALTAGQLGWDGNNTLGLGMAGGNVTQHIGEDQFFYCKASSAITKGQVVMFTGAVGASGVPTGAPATGITDGTYIMGVAAESIALNGFGLVQSFGTLRNVNTTGYADGDILWYNPAVTGGLTKTKPSAPNVKAQIAAVINGGSSGGGTILIRIDPGSQLGGTDSNVQINGVTSGETIIYDSSAGYWKNASISAGTGVSVTNGNGSITVENTGITSLAATSPVAVSSATGSSTISMPAANTSTSGYLTSTDWNTFNGKGSGTVTSVTGTSPISSSGGTTPAISISQASGSTNGYLSSTDWTTFNNKGSGSVTSVAATAGTGISISGSPITSSGTITITNTAPGLSWQSVQTGNFNATAGNAYPVNTTSAAITATLPSSPSAGQQIVFTDYAGTWATNNLTVNPNGGKIDGVASNGIVFTNRATLALVYVDSTQGWITYSNTTPSAAYSISYLIVGGGGGSGWDRGGGGGAGGLISGTTNFITGTSYTVTVGGGGAGGVSDAGTSGTNSSITGLTTAIGGGGGGSGLGGSSGDGKSGGSGGGAAGHGPYNIGTGTSGQGYNGGQGYNSGGGSNNGAGGGGGASAVGADATVSGSGAGGNGSASSITGSSVYYAGGGAGGNNVGGTGANGGLGGGGNSGSGGTVNTGGGAGGNLANGTNGNAGGSGVVIISYASSTQLGTGGTVTSYSSGGNTYWVHKFTSSGTYTA